MPDGARYIRPLVALFAACLCASAGAGEWLTNYDAAVRLAKEIDKPLLLHFYTDSCTHCVIMERNVLNQPQLRNQLGRDVVGVKLHNSANPALTRAFNVRAFPMDVMLTPDGRMLGEMTGSRPMSDYMARLTQVENQYARQRQLYLARSVNTPAARDPDGVGPSLGPGRSASQSDSGREPRGQSPLKITPLKITPQKGIVYRGLQGFSPVALSDRRKWVKGDAKYAWEYQGLTYMMNSPDEQQKFRESPEKYAPQLLGCDPVLYFDEHRAVPGSPQFAAFVPEGLYLFTSAESRDRFRDNTDRYTLQRQVLLLEELETLTR